MKGTLYITQELDHLGIVAGICEKISLIEEIDRFVGPSGRTVSVGEAIQVMVLNALGFVGRPLYLFPEFMKNKPIEKLIRKGLTADDFNEHSLGRALDIIFKKGVTEVFSLLASKSLKVFNIELGGQQLDSTSFLFHGEYNKPSTDPEAISITHGYSKDHRPDLKQVVTSLICNYKSKIPTYLEIHSGNDVDKKTFPKTIEAYVKQLESDVTHYFIADSALYSEENIQKLSGISWITRVPATIAEVKKLYHTFNKDDMKEMEEDGYSFLELGSLYGSVKQRWFLIFSEKAYKREIATLEKKIEKERKSLEQSVQSIARKEFKDYEELMCQKNALEKKGRYHKVSLEITENNHYSNPGRPRKGEKASYKGFRLTGQLAKNEEAINKAKSSKGKFILATNELNNSIFNSNNILSNYKGQGVSVESGFRFLKDPMFFAHSLFLKKPERIMALIMIMVLSLLIYALAEHWLRDELEKQNKTLPNQLGKATQKPTMRRIFQIFQGIDYLIIQNGAVIETKITNLEPIHYQILEFFGPIIQKYYFDDT